jgi:hypothetical protein
MVARHALRRLQRHLQLHLGGSARAWGIDLGYEGGEITSTWMSGFGAPVAFEINEQGEAVLTTDGMGYQRSLVAGDSITFTVQGTGADFDAKAAAFSFVDLDIVPDAQDSQGVRIDGAATNDWGSGLSQVVTLVNEGNGGIQNGAVELNLPAGRDIDITSVWGATVTREADGDLLFLALDYNASVATGGSAGFGFVATHAGGTPMAFKDSEFSFSSSPDLWA